MKFFGEIFLLFGLGYLIGHLLKLDKYIENNCHDHNEDIQLDHSEDDQNENNLF